MSKNDNAQRSALAAVYAYLLERLPALEEKERQRQKREERHDQK